MNTQAFQVAIFCLCFLSPAFGEQITGRTMGTTYQIKVVGVVESVELQHKIDQRLDDINTLMSTYINDSEVSRFNRAAAGEWFPVSQETFEVIALAQTISQRTEGAFDITVGPLVRLWNFGANATSEAFTLPRNEQIDAVSQLVGYEKLELREQPPALRKSVDGVEIDLSAIAKGYAVDQIAELLLAENINNFMVEIGGEVRVAGNREGGSSWRIGIESPDASTRRIENVVHLSNQSLASSGDYRNFHEHEGQRFSHTIDPRTGRPVAHRLGSVSVLSADCATADALATALLVMGPVDGKAWAEEQQVAALLLSRTNSGVEEIATGSFEDNTVAASPDVESNPDFSNLLIVSMLVFGIAILAMSVGVLLGRRRIQGSCGGLGGLKDEHGNTLCDGCTNPSPTCQGNPDNNER